VSQLSSADTTTADGTNGTPADDEAPVEVDERRQAVLDELTARLGDAVVGSHIRPGDDLWVRVERGAWPEVAVASKAMGYTFFDFLSAIDWLPSPFGRDMDAQEDLQVAGAPAKEAAPIEQGYAGGETRFQVIARLYSISAAMGIHFKADLPDDDLSIGTWTSTFSGANWHEREAFEMFGITFDGHPNLIKLYLPTDFQGHPLRKDFPLLARRVRPWPGIVDVEPMPGGDDSEGDGE
jgi:NADH-quinone oxidoreductase subunit C